jgi:large subunit ribosomal protein L23
MVEILKKPVITEKTEKLIEKYNTYTFEVDKFSTKVDIKKAIESLYDVKVAKVNTLKLGGGKKEMKHTNKGMIFQKTKAIKKAMVTLVEGDEIDFYSNI